MNQELISNWVFRIQYPYQSVCIDWRYPSRDFEVGVSIPGADLGDLAVLIAFFNSQKFDIPKQDILDCMLEVIGGIRKFSFHTDDHHLKKDYKNSSVDDCIWCWHLLCELKQPRDYNLTEDDTNFLVNVLEWLEKLWSRNEVLYGKHLEEAVLIINSEKYSVYHSFLDNNQELRQFFVFTPDTIKLRHSFFIEKFFQKWLITWNYNKNKIIRNLNQMVQSHLQKTASILAKDKPIYNIYFDEDLLPIIEYNKTV